MDQRAMKVAAAREAMKEIRSGMTVGLGTGSTAEELVRLIGEAIASGELKDIKGVCTSVVTEKHARSVGVQILELNDLPEIEVAIDGADEIDPQLRLLKGLGGALLREKIVEQAAKRFVVIADQSKLVEKLGVGVLPVEVVKFAAGLLEDRFRKLGFSPVLRVKEGKTFVTDEGHVILDVKIPADKDAAEVDQEIRRHAGVVDTGFFPFEAAEAIISSPEGVTRRKR